MSHEFIISALEAANEVLKNLDVDSYSYYRLKVADTSGVWTRIVRVDVRNGEESGGSAWGFIKNEDFTLWKAAGWKAPAKNKTRGLLEDLYIPSKVSNWKYGIS